ncbi:polysaccharide deacetylase family protein, partial [Paenibacillus sp. VTT E-133291]
YFTAYDADALRENVASTGAQLADVTRGLVLNNTQRPLVTFIDDDGAAAVWTVLKEVFVSRDTPCTIALVSSFLTDGIGSSKTNLLQLQNDYGWEVASHTKTHRQLNSLTLPEAEAEMSESLSELKEMGFDVKHLVYPFGGPNAAVRDLARKYYKSAVNAAGGGINNLPIKQYSINRIGLGSYMDTGKDNLTAYKALVDQAIANKSWLIFMLHIGETNAQGIQDLGDTIDYIKSQSVDIVNLDTGFEVFGNIIFNGNFNGNFDNDEYNILSKTGQQFMNHVKKTDVNSGTLISSFPIGDSTKTFLNVDSSGFPGATGAGILHTHRDANADYGFSYQTFRPYNTTSIYLRYANADNTWGAFTRIDCDVARETKVIVAAQNQFLSTSVPTDFTQDRITINTVLNGSATGFPNNLGGTLTTTRLTADAGYCSQTYQNYGTSNLYVREYVSGAWTVWRHRKIGLPKITYTYTGGTVPAQSGLRVTVPYNGVSINDVISMSIQTQIPLGVSFHARMSDIDSVEVNFVNSTTSPVALGALTICLVAVRN